MSKIANRLLLIAALGMAATAQAQNAKPAGQKTDVNKQMTRTELRACMKLQDDIKSTAASLEQRKTAMQDDKAKIAPAQDELKALRADVDEKLAAAKALDAESAAQARRVEAWNVEWKEAQESTMRSAERKRKELDVERKQMDARMKTLQAERDTKISAYQAAVDRLNAKSAGLQEQVEGWNSRNDALADDGDKLIDMRATYSADCSNRKFDERDEIAIKKGQ